MLKQIKKNRWECLLYAFANALGLPPEYIISRVGHDGSRMVVGHPQGFHIQELLTVARDVSVWPSPIELCPVNLYPNGEVFYPVSTEAWWTKQVVGQLRFQYGVITGLNYCGGGHAVAFERGRVFDADRGDEYLTTLEEFQKHGFIPQTAWIFRCQSPRAL